MAYNLWLSGHLGKEETYKLPSQYYFWPKIIDCHGTVLTRTVSYYFLLLAGPPLAPWRLPLLFIYDTPFYLLLLFIPQCSYSAY